MTKSGGGLELYSWLGLEASRETDFKRDTWNVGWTLRFSSRSNLWVSENFFSNTLNGLAYGPMNLWLNPSGNRKFLMFNHTSSPTWNFTSRRDLSAKSLYLLCASPSWPLPTPTSVSFLHQVVWPLALPHLHHSRVVLVLPKSWAQLVICLSPFKMGWIRLRSVLSCCNKTRLTPNDPPNLVDPPPHNSSKIVGSPSWPFRFVHRFGDEMKCSSWVPTPFASTRPAKTYL